MTDERSDPPGPPGGVVPPPPPPAPPPGGYFGRVRVHRPTMLDETAVSSRRRRRPAPGRWERMARLRRWYASVIVWARWLVVLGWIAAVGVTTIMLPTLTSVGGGGFGGFTQKNSEAIATEVKSVDLFSFPVITRVLVVQYNPNGFSQQQQKQIVQRAIDIDEQKPQYADLGRAYAVPLINAKGPNGLKLGSGKPGTVAVTVFGFPTTVPFDKQVDLAHTFIHNHTGPNDHVVGVTGLFAGRVQQLYYLHHNLTLLEIVTLGAVLLVVGLRFRSPVASVITLLVAGASYALVIHITAWVTQTTGTSIPSDLEPLLIALLLGVGTDYSIFYMAGMQDRIGNGDNRLQGARVAAAEFTPIVLTAGLTVSATVLALLAAKLQLFRTFGPGLAITVAITMLVSVTLVPALLAILGRWTFWPWRAKPLVPPEAEAMFGADRELDPTMLTRRGKVARFLTHRPVAVVVVLATIAGAYFATVPVRHMHLELGVTTSVPTSDEVRKAAVALGHGFPRGLMSPTVVLLQGNGVGNKTASLVALENDIAHVKGVSAVIGPREQYFAQYFSQQGQSPYGAVIAKNRNAVRYIVLFDSFPTDYPAMDSLRHIESQMPGWLKQTGLTSVQVGYAGDTQLSREATTATTGSLYRIAIVAFGIDFILLALFLRALIAPIYLLATNTMALVMALGITTYLFQDVVGFHGLVFYVPFAAFVLLLALGSDYNIFAVGSVWEEASGRHLKDAIVLAIPRSTSAITAAGVALAASFGLLAIVPISPMQELGVVLCLGILIDAFIVRSLLVPALLSLFGRFSGWPGKRLADEPHPDDQREPART